MRDDKVIQALSQKRDAIRRWLKDEAPYAEANQKHLDKATPERAYWHLGYQSACTDLMSLLVRETPTTRH